MVSSHSSNESKRDQKKKKKPTNYMALSARYHNSVLEMKKSYLAKTYPRYSEKSEL